MPSALSASKLAKARGIIQKKVMPNKCDISIPGTPGSAGGGYQTPGTPVTFLDQWCGILSQGAMMADTNLVGLVVATEADWGISLEYGSPAALALDAAKIGATITTDTGLLLTTVKVVDQQSWALATMVLCKQLQKR